MKTRKPQKDLPSESQVTALITLLMGTTETISRIKKELDKCIVPAIDTGKTMIDPFRLRKTLKETEPEAVRLIPDAASHYASLRDWVVGDMAKINAGIDARLNALCAAVGFRLEGHFPAYIIEGFLPVQVRQASEEAIVIEGKSFPTLLVDTVFPAIAKAVEDERARKCIPEDFVEQLYKAYERTVLLQKGKLGESMQVRKVFQELVWVRQLSAFLSSGRKERFSEYPIEYFARDVGKMVSAAAHEVSNRPRMMLAPTTFPSEGIVIRDGEEVRIVGSIAFV